MPVAVTDKAQISVVCVIELFLMNAITHESSPIWWQAFHMVIQGLWLLSILWFCSPQGLWSPLHLTGE